MTLKKPINENYAATIVQINEIKQLPNCDNVASAIVFGNSIIVSKDTVLGSQAIYFPVECKLSESYLKENNLYRDSTKNKDTNEKGYFEDNGRIKCMKFRGHRSEGLLMPINSLLFAAESKDLIRLNLGDTFDNLNGISICEKYVPFNPNPNKTTNNQQAKKRISRIKDGQFKFHADTNQLGKNMWNITPSSLLSITNKLHGTSFIVGQLLCTKKLKWYEKFISFLGISINSDYYDTIYSSRKVIKNDGGNPTHYYGEDVWAEATNHLKPHLYPGMTIYGEIVGFTPSGGYIQAGYDYGCTPKLPEETYTEGIHFKVYIYKITLTSPLGNTITLPTNAVQNWCKEKALRAVPEYFFGKAKEFLPVGQISDEEWRALLLEKLLIYYNMEKDCEICKNNVPAEGIVIVIDGQDSAYKLKSFRFKEHETKQLDKGVVDMETEESQE